MSNPRLEALRIEPPLMVTPPLPKVSRLTPVAAPFVETEANVMPPAPTVVLATFNAVPLVVEMVLVLTPVCTVTVPPPVALKAEAVVVVNCRPPLVKLMVEPVFVASVTAATAAVLMDFVPPLKVIVPPVLFCTLMGALVISALTVTVAVPAVPVTETPVAFVPEVMLPAMVVVAPVFWLVMDAPAPVPLMVIVPVYDSVPP